MAPRISLSAPSSALLALVASSGCALLYDFDASGNGGEASTSTSDASASASRAIAATTTDATSSATTAAGADPCVDGPYAACILSPGHPRPVVYFDFDTSMSSTIPSAPSLTVSSNVSLSLADDDRLGQGLLLSDAGRVQVNGGGLRELVGGAIASSETFTIELWFRVDALQEGEETTPFAYFSTTSNESIQIFASDRGKGAADPDIRFHRRTSSSAEDVVDLDLGVAKSVVDRTFHVVASFDGSSMSLHVDGVEAAPTSASEALPAASGWQDAFFLGGDGSDGVPGDVRFVGLVDEVAIYDTTLDASTIAMHCALGKGAPCIP